MKLFSFAWGLIYIYIISESKESALEKIRASDSVARKEYPECDFESG